MKNIAVKQIENEPEVPFEVLATAIEKIGEGMRRLEESRLTKEALVVLLKNSTGVPYATIRQVLLGLEGLEEKYLKKAGKKK